MINQSQKKLIELNFNEDVSKLALRGIDKFVLQQISGRRKFKNKLPFFYDNLDLVLPQTISLEQSSSEKSAQYKASIVSGEIGIDLTGGFGIDTIFLSKKFNRFIYVEQNEELYQIAKHNFKQLDLNNIEAVNSSAEEYLDNLEFADFIYADPARRSNDKKIFTLNDSSPNLIELFEKIKSKCNSFIFKLSPMLDISLTERQLDKDLNFQVVKYQNENKELLATNIGSKYVAIDLDSTQKTNIDLKVNEIDYSDEGTFIYEPGPEILKLSISNTLANKSGFKKIASNTNLFLSKLELDVPHFSCYSIILKKEVSKKIESEIQGINAIVKSRNYYLTVQEIRKKYNIREGKEKYLFFYRNNANKACFVLAKRIEIKKAD